MNKTKNGFSLFELLVSISIIGILVAVVSLSFSSAQKKARDAKRIQDLNAIQKAAEQYYAGNNSLYPQNKYSSAGMPWTDAGGNNILLAWPVDPKNGQSSWHSVYTTYSYRTTGQGTTTNYCIYALLENSGTGNCDAACAFTGANKDFYCVQNQQ